MTKALEFIRRIVQYTLRFRYLYACPKFMFQSQIFIVENYENYERPAAIL